MVVAVIAAPISGILAAIIEREVLGAADTTGRYRSERLNVQVGSIFVVGRLLVAAELVCCSPEFGLEA